MRTALLALLLAGGAFASPVVARAGKVTFFSETPVENIQATTTTAVSRLDIQARTVSIRMRNTTFEFPNKLMQEHFNENYMESSKYPVSGFDGVLKDLDTTALEADKTVEVVVEGTLDVHGVKKARTIKAQLHRLPDGGYAGTAKFMVKVADHDIKVPTLVVAKIAEDMQITAEFHWTPEEAKK